MVLVRAVFPNLPRDLPHGRPEKWPFLRWTSGTKASKLRISCARLSEKWPFWDPCSFLLRTLGLGTVGNHVTRSPWLCQVGRSPWTSSQACLWCSSQGGPQGRCWHYVVRMWSSRTRLSILVRRRLSGVGLVCRHWQGPPRGVSVLVVRKADLGVLPR